MKCANNLNNRFKFIRGIWALHKVKELHKQLASLFVPLSSLSYAARHLPDFYEIVMED
jgi:hypothetical protein